MSNLPALTFFPWSSDTFAGNGRYGENGSVNGRRIQAEITKGTSINDVRENFGFLDPLPPCHIRDHATYQYGCLTLF